MHPTLMGELDFLTSLGRLNQSEDRFGRSHSPPAGVEHRLTVHHRVVHLVDLAAVVYAGGAPHHAEAIVVVDPNGALPADPHVAALAGHNQGAGVARIVEAGSIIRICCALAALPRSVSGVLPALGSGKLLGFHSTADAQVLLVLG